MVTCISRSPENTQALGAEWGRQAEAGWLIGLIGELGAGKTQIVKGIAIGLGIRRPVTSPTFTLVHEYDDGRLPLCHIDLYRLETAHQVQSAGLDEYLDAPRGITVVEWIDRWLGPGPPAGWTPIESGAGPGSRLRLFYRQVQIRSTSETERQIAYEDFSR